MAMLSHPKRPAAARARRAALAACTMALAAGILGAGHAPKRSLTLAVPAVHLQLEQANAVLESDRGMGDTATAYLRQALKEQGAYAMVDPARVDSTARAMPEGASCVTDACALELAKSVGADRVLMTRLTKISTPVWFVDARLLDARTGRAVRADQFELKGIPGQIIPKGMVVVARRVSGTADSVIAGE